MRWIEDGDQRRWMDLTGGLESIKVDECLSKGGLHIRGSGRGLRQVAPDAGVLVQPCMEQGHRQTAGS